MPFSNSDVQKLLWHDLQSEKSKIARILHYIFHDNDVRSIRKKIRWYYVRKGRNLQHILDLCLQYAVIIGPDEDAVTEYLLKRGANPIRVSKAVIKFKRATWQLFHPYSKTEYSDSHDPDDDSDEEHNDRNNDDSMDYYESHDAEEGCVPPLLEKTTALHITALIGKVATTQKLLGATMELLKKKKKNQEHAMNYFKTCISMTRNNPLITAAWMGKIDIVKLFLPYQAHLPGGGWLRTPLHAASARGHLDIVNVLIERESGIHEIENAAGWYGTPLCAACCHGQKDVAELLLKHGAEVNPQSTSALQTPLSNAIMNNQLEITRFLLDNGAVFNPDLLLARIHRVGKSTLDIVLQYATTNQEAKWRYNALCIKCYFGDYKYVSRFLSSGKEMLKLQQLNDTEYEYLGDTGPFVIAIKHRHRKLFDRLRKEKTPSIFRGNVVLTAVELGNDYIIKSVLKDHKKYHLDCDKCKNGASALYAAILCETYGIAIQIREYMHQVDDKNVKAVKDVKQLLLKRLSDQDGLQ